MKREERRESCIARAWAHVIVCVSGCVCMGGRAERPVARSEPVASGMEPTRPNKRVLGDGRGGLCRECERLPSTTNCVVSRYGFLKARLTLTTLTARSRLSLLRPKSRHPRLINELLMPISMWYHIPEHIIPDMAGGPWG